MQNESNSGWSSAYYSRTFYSKTVPRARCCHGPSRTAKRQKIHIFRGFVTRWLRCGGSRWPKRVPNRFSVTTDHPKVRKGTWGSPNGDETVQKAENMVYAARRTVGTKAATWTPCGSEPDTGISIPVSVWSARDLHFGPWGRFSGVSKDLATYFL